MSESLDFAEAAVAVGCHFVTIDRAARSGELPFSWHPGRRKRLVSRPDLEAWASRRAMAGGPSAEALSQRIARLEEELVRLRSQIPPTG